MNAPIPDDPALDIGNLVRALDDKTQCYKVLMMKGLVGEMHDGGPTRISYATIAARMVQAAWWPVRRHDLAIGHGDILSKAVKLIAHDTPLIAGNELLARIIADLPVQRGHGGFLRHVPQRLLRPWFPEKKSDEEVDKEIPEIGLANLLLRGLPFAHVAATEDEGEGVEVHPGWHAYFARNKVVLQGWLDLQWLDWVQRRNPMVPVRMSKLVPTDRSALASRKLILDEACRSMVASGDAPQCIYTRLILPEKSVSTDHFMPWRFVAHDELWNLVPVVSVTVNSIKSDRIPDDAFVAPLAAFHRRVMSYLVDLGEDGDPVRDEYGFGLRRNPAALLEPGVLEAAYAEVVPPQLAAARGMHLGRFPFPYTERA